MAFLVSSQATESDSRGPGPEDSPAGGGVSWRRVPGVQPSVMLEEFLATEAVIG